MKGETPSGCDNMKVCEFEEGDGSRWDRFVEQHESGTFFHLSGWKTILEDVLHHPTFYLYCAAGDEILAVLPLAQVKSFLFGNALISLPFLVYGGILSTDPAAERLLLDAATKKAANLKVDYLELRNRKSSNLDWPKKSHYATFSKTLDPDPDKNLMAIPRKQRAMVRKGMKFGLTAAMDSDAGRLYDAMLPCKRNLGTPFFDRNYLQSIMDQFGKSVEVTTVTQNSETVCSVMSFRFRDQILPYYGGGGDSARILNGNDFMYWSVMQKACLDGVQTFDFGRSMEGSGAYRFKKHWGFEPMPLSYEYFLVKKDSLPNLNPSNARFDLAIRLWKKLPLPVAGFVGPMLARRLG